MIEWTFFYRALGIPDDAIKPTYYELLDLDPESCTPELVDEHRNQQRIRLRQSIPSPEFIPMILRFEKHKLDHAAAVLRDPARKRKYDQHLAQKAEEQIRQEKKDKARRALARKIRVEVEKHLNPDKTLSDASRPLLAAALRELGVKDKEVEEFLDKIPAPAKPTSRPSEEVIKYFAKFVDLAIRGHTAAADAREWTMGMAHTLGISTSQAGKIFDRILEKRGVSAPSEPQDEDDSGPYKLAEPIEEPESAHLAGPFPDESWSDVSASDDDLTVVSRLGSLPRIVLVVVPIVAIGFFALLVWLFYGRSKLPTTVTLPPDDRPRLQAGVSGLRGTGLEPNDSSRGDIRSGEQQVANGPEPNEPNVPPVVLITPDELKKSFAGSNAYDEEVLADIAFTMSLCCARAIQFSSEAVPSDAPLQSALALAPTERWATLTRNVNLGDWTADVQGMIVEAESKKPKDFSIIELAESDTPEAAQELLNRLSVVKNTAGTRGKVTQTKQAARYIHALGQMHDPDIPVKLIDMIERSGPTTAYLIVQALISKARGRVDDEGRLTFASEGWERRDCAAYWRRNPPSWGGSRSVTRPSRLRSSGRITSSLRPPPSPSPPPVTSKGTSPKLQPPDPDILKLLGVVTHFANKMAAVLAQDGQQDSEALLKDLLDSPRIDLAEPNRIATDLLFSLQSVRESVRSRIRAEETDDIEASAKERERWIRSSASPTILQETVVEMDAMADLISLLINRSAVDDEMATEMQDILRKRTEAVGRALTVTEQLRESCYYDFVLWHRLLELRSAGPVP